MTHFVYPLRLAVVCRAPRADQDPAKYGSFLAVDSIAASGSNSTAVESHVPATS